MVFTVKITKKILSVILAAALVLAALPVCITTGSAVTDDSLKMNRPMANLYVTPVTRVAYEQNSMKAPSGNNSVIVKSTPSGMPYLSSTKTAITYAGETPVATQIVFTPGVELDETPVLLCNNSTVKWNETPTHSNGTYTWTVSGGTATAGTFIVFTVSYKFSETNAVTGKTYTNTYTTSAATHVEAIATPAGIYTTKKTYELWGVESSTKNRSYVASFILGQNTYGSIYNNGAADGSIAFDRYSWTLDNPGWTDVYGAMQHFDGEDASRNYNVAYGVDTNRPVSTVYFDTSMNSTLSDLNLRMVVTNLCQAEEYDERVSVTLNDVAVLDGSVKTFDGSKDDFNLTSDSVQAAQLNITKPTLVLYAIGANTTSYFTGMGPGTNNTSTDYTVAYQFKTSAQWNEVFVTHNYTLRVVTYDKGALRSLVENVQSLDPTVMTTEIPENDYKGYNPQSWYYSNGWDVFNNALNNARALLNRPVTNQSEIDAQYNVLKSAYDSLEIKKADYTLASAYYNQAVKLNPANYTNSTWARLQNVLNGYCDDYSALYQPAVDKLAADIKAAIDALEERTADYSQFNSKLITVNNYVRTAEMTYGRTAEQAYSGWAAVVSVLNKSGCSYNKLDGYVVEDYLLISDQATVDGYVLLLDSAIKNIRLNGADYSAASAAESAYRLIKINYVADSVAPGLTAAYNALTALHGLDISHQPEIDAAVAELNTRLGRVVYKPADTAAAENLIAYANSLDPSQYNDFRGVEKAVANLESKLTLDIRYQSEIDSAVAALRSAIDKLLTHTADYTLVDVALAEVAERERLILETYEDTYGYTAATFYSNWSNVVLCVNNVVRGLDMTQQTTVDGFASAINNALANLQENTADYSAVSELQSRAYTLCTTGSSLYTQNSLDNLLVVYVNVENNLPVSRQAEVDAYEQAIQQAIDGLQYLPANYSAVNQQTENANAVFAADEAFSQAHPGYTLYTSESLAGVAVAVAEVVDGLDIRYQSTVDGYAAAIEEATDALRYGPADYTAVSEALAGIPEDTSVYTSLSLTTLNATVNSVTYGLTADRQATVDKYVTNINNAIGRLKLKNADYSAVNSALSGVPADSSLYTPDSWQAVQDQVNAVVTGLDITHQDEVNLMAENIRTAVGFLAYRGADYSEVEAAKNLIPAELSYYTDGSVAALNAALDAVDYYCSITQQTAVDGFAAAISDAVQHLELKSADYDSLNSAVAEAEEKIATGWYTAESVAVLNAELEKVEQNLDITHQSEIDNLTADIVKATKELVLKLADYTEVQNLLNLLDNSASEIYTITYSNFNEIMSLIVAYRTETVDNNMNLTVDRQAEVDAMRDTLQGYIDSLEPVVQTERFELCNGASVKSGKYIIGLRTKLTRTEFENKYTVRENVTVSYSNSKRILGTGTVITVRSSFDPTVVIAEYTVLVYGDIDGSGDVEIADANMLQRALRVGLVLTPVQKLAADVAGTRVGIDTTDYSMLVKTVKKEVFINQLTGKAK